MKRIFGILTTVIIGIVVLSIICEAVPYEEWSKTYGGTGEDNFQSVSQTSDGGYIAVGRTYTTNVQIHLVKTDSFGNKKWSKTFGGSSHEGAYSVQQTIDGGYIFAGYTHNSYGNDDGLIIKTDSSGNVLWDKKYGGSNNDGFTSIQQTTDGGYIVTGGTMSFGSGGSDGWIVKVDTYGNQLWSKTYGDSNDQKAYSIMQTTDGGYILSIGSLDMYYSDGFVIKTDMYGNELWQKDICEDCDSGIAKSVQQTTDGGYIIGTESYWHSPVVGSGTSGTLMKIDAYGNTQWERSGSVLLKSTQQTSDGGYISVGGSYQSCDPNYCDPDPMKGIIIKTDSSGIEMWNKTFDVQKDDQLNSVQQTNDGGYIIAGYIKPSEVGNYEAWLVKLSTDNKMPQVIAHRTIDKTILTAGSDAIITVDIQNDDTVRSLSLKESIPSEWSLTRISDNADQFKKNTNEWIWFTMANNAVKTVKYKVTVPYGTEPGTYNINGYITTNGIVIDIAGDNTISVVRRDILSYYRGLGIYSNIVETSDLLKAADDWRDNIIPPGFSVSITTNQLLTLADEWRNS